MAANTMAQHFIAANGNDGKASFHELPNKPKTTTTPFGSATLVYINPSLPADVSVDATADLTATAEHSQTGLAGLGGRICPDGGMNTMIYTLNPGITAPFHRTRTLDCGVVLEGDVELHLDNGSMRSLTRGDTFVFRGAMHSWANTTDQEVKIFGIAIDSQPVRDANGDEMKEGFVDPSFEQ